MKYLFVLGTLYAVGTIGGFIGLLYYDWEESHRPGYRPATTEDFLFVPLLWPRVLWLWYYKRKNNIRRG